MKDIIERRIDFSLNIEKELYAEGLLDIIGFLYDELKSFLKKEDRYFGIVKSYTTSIDIALSRVNSRVKEESIEIYGKILYLFKPFIKKEFKRLVSRKLTSGDAVIVLIHKLIGIILSEVNNFEFIRELKTIKKIIDKLFNNIRNKNKNDSLYYVSNIIRTCLIEGLVGKYSIDAFSLTDLDFPKEKLGEPSICIEEKKNIMTEISLLDDE